MKVLAGDIGGTKTLLQLAHCTGDKCEALLEQRFDSNGHPHLLPMIEKFLQAAAAQQAQPVARACFGIAGPVTERDGCQVAKLTNLPWEIDTGQLAAVLQCDRVRLINDFQAIGYGIDALGDDDLVVLQQGSPRERGSRVIVGAGTGLGVGLMYWADDHYETIPSEGGHVDFAPIGERQIALLRYLQEKCGRASCERILSGPGLINIYEFLRHTTALEESEELRQAMRSNDPAAAVSEFALTQKDALAAATLDLFVDIYGALTGDLAQTVVATGGVYIAGGIAPKIIDKLSDGSFINNFVDKGRMGDLLARMPVKVVMNPKVGLMGAALAASRL